MSVWRGTVFRDYDAVGLDQFEVCVADGVITANFDKLDAEMTRWQAEAVADLFQAAAKELGAKLGR